MNPIDENLTETNDREEENFEKLLEGTPIRNETFAVGDKVRGTVVFITDENVFIDISGKSEAVAEVKEFLNESGDLTIANGDSIEAYIVSMNAGEILVSTSIGRGHANPELLRKAHQLNIPVEGTILDTVKGGYTVSVSGISCFCPYSQVDIKSPPDPESLLKQTFEFQIIEFSDRGRNIILSRKVLLEKYRAEQLKQLKETIAEGDIISGKVVSIQDFGIFADIGGTEALIPKSEISWSRRPRLESFHIGQTVQAKIISLDWEHEKIGLSIKQLNSEPWENIERYHAGQQVNGTVTNTIRKGAFVEIEPGLEGFIPLSRMSLIKRINSPEEVLAVDNTISVRILEINPDDKKMLLELITDEPDPWLAPTDSLMEKAHSATVESSRDSGLTVRISNGMAGFVPASELIQGKGDLQKTYPVGSVIKVAVKDIIKEERRLILSERRAVKREEMEEYKKYMSVSPEGQESDSTIGNIFKDTFAEIKKKMEEEK